MTKEELKDKLASITDISFEKSVIGAILMDFKLFQNAKDIGITKSHFQDDFCKRMFVVSEMLHEQNRFDEISYSHLLSGFKTKFGEKQQARLDGKLMTPVQAVLLLRSLISSTASFKADCYKLIENLLIKNLYLSVLECCERIEDKYSILETISTHNEQIKLIANLIPTLGTESALSVYNEVFKQDTNILNGTALSDSLYLDYDSMNGHEFKKGELIIIGARPSMGKTATMLNWAQRLYKRSEVGLNQFCGKVGIVSLEMSNSAIIRRLKSQLASFPKWKLKTENDLKIEKSILIKRGVDLSKYVLAKDPRSELNDIVQQVNSMAKQGCEAIFIDYLGLITNSFYRNNKVLEIGSITSTLAKLAKSNNIPIFLLSQLSRECEKRSGFDKRPQLSDLRDSGSIEQDADQIFMLFRPAYKNYKLTGYEDPNGYEMPEFADNSRLLEVNNLKNRNGNVGDFFLLEYHLETQEIKDFGSSSVCVCKHEQPHYFESYIICECCNRTYERNSNIEPNKKLDIYEKKVDNGFGFGGF